MPTTKLEQEFTVKYRNRSGDMTTKTATATGVSNKDVQKRYENLGYQVIAVIYQRLTGRTITVK